MKDRVYPELQRLLSQQDSRVAVGKDAEWERVLARAACLRDVCRERLVRSWKLPPPACTNGTLTVGWGGFHVILGTIGRKTRVICAATRNF